MKNLTHTTRIRSFLILVLLLSTLTTVTAQAIQPATYQSWRQLERQSYRESYGLESAVRDWRQLERQSYRESYGLELNDDARSQPKGDVYRTQQALSYQEVYRFWRAHERSSYTNPFARFNSRR
ncbi:MAG: hypothetical protein JSV66_11245 [Trueperaceae bacterium]|nr:MAG: hypothetical protein JSV66_11245 [Trueperaceae bacterium]